MTQLAVGCPLGEFDLRDELGANPVRPLVGLRTVLERALLRLERLQQLHDARELFFVEARSGMADVNQGLGTARLRAFGASDGPAVARCIGDEGRRGA